MNLLEKIGLVLTKPKTAFEIILLDESKKDGYLIPIMVAINSVAVSYSFSSNYGISNFLFEISLLLIWWFLYAAVLGFIIKVVYKVPGRTIEFIELANYTQVSFIIVSVASIIILLLKPILQLFLMHLFFIIFGLINGVIWYLFLHILLYYATKAYFKIDLIQFIVSVLISWIIITLMMIPTIMLMSICTEVITG